MGSHGRMAVTEKVDLGAALKKISAYMRSDLALMITALVLAAFGAVLTIIGPDKIGEMTNLMADGFASGIDMAAVAKIGIFLAVIYGLSEIFTSTKNLNNKVNDITGLNQTFLNLFFCQCPLQKGTVFPAV